MSDRVQCTCPRCRIRGLMAPSVIITVGVLFLLQEMRGGFFDFSNTYPIILIVMGIISLAGALASSEGHVSAASAQPPSTPVVPPSPYPGQGQ